MAWLRQPELLLLVSVLVGEPELVLALLLALPE